MRIKYLKVYDAMKRIGKSIGVGVLLICLSLPITGCTKVEQDVTTNDRHNVTQQYNNEERILQPYESIISVPVKFDPTFSTCKYAYHLGYKCVGIGTSSYGKISAWTNGDFGGACLLFVNDKEVRYTRNADGTMPLFGVPVEELPSAYVNSDGTAIFYEGQHIISVEIDDPTKKDMTYSSHEGYVPIGIATAAYGKDFRGFAGAVILFTNSKTVIVEKNKDGGYTDFGKVYEEKEETKTLQKQ